MNVCMYVCLCVCELKVRVQVGDPGWSWRNDTGRTECSATRWISVIISTAQWQTELL